jgi:hypothetical protein
MMRLNLESKKRTKGKLGSSKQRKYLVWKIEVKTSHTIINFEKCLPFLRVIYFSAVTVKHSWSGSVGS